MLQWVAEASLEKVNDYSDALEIELAPMAFLRTMRFHNELLRLRPLFNHGT